MSKNMKPGLYTRYAANVDARLPGGSITRHALVGGAGAGVGVGVAHWGGIGTMPANAAIGGGVGVAASIMGDWALIEEEDYIAEKAKVHMKAVVKTVSKSKHASRQDVEQMEDMLKAM